MIKKMSETIHIFNDQIRQMKILLAPCFPIKLELCWKMELCHMESMAVDGALNSPALRISSRINEHNPRILVSHCGSHHNALVYVQANIKNVQHCEANNVYSKLFILWVSAASLITYSRNVKSKQVCKSTYLIQ